MMKTELLLVGAAALAVIGMGATRAPAPPKPAKPIKALLVLGGCCHDYAKQQEILTKGISERANVEWTIAYDPDTGTKHKNPVYDNPEWYKGFDVVVHDECTSDVTDINVVESILKPHKNGLPAVFLHCGMHSYRTEGFPKATPWFELTGLASTGHGPQVPIAISFVDQDNPITKGIADWSTIHEELYNNSNGKLHDTAHALARGKQVIKGNDGNETIAESVCVWTNTYNGKTRVFSTTIGHNNETVSDPRYLDMVTRGILWTVKKLDKDGKPAAGYGPKQP
jgi:type 1 glutamine amidotransferase